MLGALVVSRRLYINVIFSWFNRECGCTDGVAGIACGADLLQPTRLPGDAHNCFFGERLPRGLADADQQLLRGTYRWEEGKIR